jgi:membrane protein implicated in regulation of membrane protease activity
VKPDPAAVIIAVICAAEAGIALACGWPWAAVAFATLAVAALALLWRVPLCDQDGNDIEALMRATREQVPDFVPDEWVRKP